LGKVETQQHYFLVTKLGKVETQQHYFLQVNNATN